jgi:prepilin-type N-terminal cleavage/methylation domain-containing protein
MKFLKNLKTKKGFSLIEISIAAAIAAGLSLYMARMSQNMSAVTKRLESKVDEVQFLSNMHQLFSNPASCTRTMGTYCPKKVGEIVNAQECGTGFTYGLNLKDKIIIDGSISNNNENAQEIIDSTLGLGGLYLSETYKFMNVCEISRIAETTDPFSIIQSFRVAKQMMKNVFLQDLKAIDKKQLQDPPNVSNGSDLNYKSSTYIPKLDSTTYNWIIRDRQEPVRLDIPIKSITDGLFGPKSTVCPGAKFSNNLTVTNVRVGMLEKALPNIEYEMHINSEPQTCIAGLVCESKSANYVPKPNKGSYANSVPDESLSSLGGFLDTLFGVPKVSAGADKGSSTGSKRLINIEALNSHYGCGSEFKNHGTTFKDPYRSYEEACCNSNSVPRRFKCMDFIESSESSGRKMGQLMIIVEYKLKSDTAVEGFDRRKTKKYIVNAQMVPKINGQIMGSGDDDGVFIGNCGNYVKEIEHPQDSFVAVDPLKILKHMGRLSGVEEGYPVVKGLWQIEPALIQDLSVPRTDINVNIDITTDPYVQVQLQNMGMGDLINPKVLDDSGPDINTGEEIMYSDTNLMDTTQQVQQGTQEMQQMEGTQQMEQMLQETQQMEQMQQGTQQMQQMQGI